VLENTLMGNKAKKGGCASHTPFPLSRGELIKHPQRKIKTQ
jgi:hypothetical protein